MHKLFTLFLIISFCIPVEASRTVVTQSPYNYSYYSPYYNNHYDQDKLFKQPHHVRYYNHISNELSGLEKYTFDRTYIRENNLSRLERLELQAFGAIQEGDFNTRYQNVHSAILSRPKINNYQKQSVLKSISDYFTGKMTGYTPLLDNISPTNYGSRKYTTYSSPWGDGYRYDDYSTNSYSGVRILD